MLKDHKNSVENLRKKFISIEHWDEITFNDDHKAKLLELESVEYVYDHSIHIKIEGETNHIIIPSQYVLYAIAIKSFATNVYNFIEAFEKYKNQSGLDNNKIADEIENKSLNYSILGLDSYSENLGPKIFWDEKLNLDAKSIVNVKAGKNQLRGLSDFFGSIVLKPINIPNASASILGKFIYNLCKNSKIYSYLEMEFIKNLPLIIKDNIIKNFAYQIFDFLISYDNLSKIKHLISKNSATHNTYSIKDDAISLTSIFTTSPTPLLETYILKNDIRIFPEPLFFDKEYYYFSTEWTFQKGSRLDLENLITILKKYYPEFYFENLANDYFYKPSVALTKKINIQTIKSTSKTKYCHHGENIIYFGAPGTGKSKTIDDLIDENNSVRTVFHAETYYSDFVGCLKPTMGDDGIEYNFQVGPFTEMLIKALNDPEHHYYLVIEEINRAKSAAVFGEIFQLLDRENGESKYSIKINDQDLLKVFAENLLTPLTNNLIKIPKNLSILATMNTSDQAVEPMDTAFKRRWKYVYKPIDFTTCAKGNFLIKRSIGDITVSWEALAKHINDFLANLEIPEDRHLGPWFVKDEEISTSDKAKDTLGSKILMYLWDDVLRHEGKSELFSSEIKTYGQLISKLNNDEIIFNSSFSDSLK
ncbi:AAA family ATPase [Acinetobacter faecalis]|uniref:AAA family ATPase n=1 Tax=Acinetobacter faecalis TaxID=2665161 RepID=UPI002A9182B0|nr:AAA family ATPase [Acinetobacter faecalis]MDY6456804.1 AAA family ATPase [Acinetobacter faecalis]